MASVWQIVAIITVMWSTTASSARAQELDDSTSLLQHNLNFRYAKSGKITAKASLLEARYQAQIRASRLAKIPWLWPSALPLGLWHGSGPVLGLWDGPSPGQQLTQGSRTEVAKLPPVRLDEQDNIRKLGTVSTPGMWKQYYNLAEKDMDEQWKIIYPMIRGSNFGQVLEVAAGVCRNTEKLLPLVGHVLVTDIDPTSVDTCRHRFENRPDENSKLSYSVVDGVHLPVRNSSVSLIYQFDSGVHFHREVIRGYLAEFQRVLVPGGTGFFHHSNLAASQYPVKDDIEVTQNRAWRSNMSRALFEQYSREAGLEMLCHPLVTWGGHKDLDAFARFRKPGVGLVAVEPESCPLHLEL